jgi:hypothetical protein
MKNKNNKLCDLCPHLKEEWDFEKNKDLDFYAVTCGMARKAWWKCKNGHSSFTRIQSRAAGRKCLYCSGKKNSPLSETDPRLLDEWSFEKNVGIDPHKITRGYHTRVWWKCKNGHEWQACIHNRVKSKVGCLYCINKKVNSENSLATKCPDVAIEFHSEKNSPLSASGVNYLTYKKVWWMCQWCGHEWITHVRCRTRKKFPTGCPACNFSKGEARIKSFLIEHGLKYESQKRFADCKDKKPLPFDFHLPELNCLIEYQGQQHFEPVCFGNVDYIDSFTSMKKRDEMKVAWAKDNNYKLILISYENFGSIETILKRELLC